MKKRAFVFVALSAMMVIADERLFLEKHDVYTTNELDYAIWIQEPSSVWNGPPDPLDVIIDEFIVNFPTSYKECQIESIVLHQYMGDDEVARVLLARTVEKEISYCTFFLNRQFATNSNCILVLKYGLINRQFNIHLADYVKRRPFQQLWDMAIAKKTGVADSQEKVQLEIARAYNAIKFQKWQEAELILLSVLEKHQFSQEAVEAAKNLIKRVQKMSMLTRTVQKKAR